MLIVAAGFEPRQRILYRVSRKKLLAALRVAHQMQPRVRSPRDRSSAPCGGQGAPHQEFWTGPVPRCSRGGHCRMRTLGLRRHGRRRIRGDGGGGHLAGAPKPASRKRMTS